MCKTDNINKICKLRKLIVNSSGYFSGYNTFEERFFFLFYSQIFQDFLKTFKY